MSKTFEVQWVLRSVICISATPRMEGNVFLGKVHSKAFSVNVTERATIGTQNNFTNVSGGAFEEIRVEDDMKVIFTDNEVKAADRGALKFYNGRVQFTEKLFTGLTCPCEGGITINGAARERDRHILRLLGGDKNEKFAVSLNA